MNFKERAVKAISSLKNKLLGNSGLKKHEAKKSMKMFSRSHCEKTFERKFTLKVHERKHTGEKPYSCNFCDYKCRLKHNLKSHEKLHTGDKPFSCSECDKRFTRKEALKSHVKLHTGDKPPFNCSKCDSEFGRIRHLKRHEKIHQAETSNSGNWKAYANTNSQHFGCSNCDQSFSTALSLRVHERIHKDDINTELKKSDSRISLAEHGEIELNDLRTRTLRISVRKIDILSCSKFDKKFTLKFALMKHEAKHNAITYKGRPFGCQHCGKTFTDPDSWQRHERLMVRGGKRLC